MTLTRDHNLQNISLGYNGYKFLFGELCSSSLTLSEYAIDKIIHNEDNILSDLQNDESIAEKEYWSDENIHVFSKSKSYSEFGGFLFENTRVLYIQNKVFQTLTLNVSGFKLMIILLKILKRSQESGCTYRLQNRKQCLSCSSKKISIDVFASTYSIFDDASKKTITLPLIQLAKMIERTEEFLYNDWQKKSIAPDLWKECELMDIFRCEHTFRQLLFYLGLPVWKDSPSNKRIIKCNRDIKINPITDIQFLFSKDKNYDKFVIKNCAISKNVYFPLSALEAVFHGRWRILFDLVYYNEIQHISFGPDEWIEQYWSDGRYAVRFGVSLNSDTYIRFIDLRKEIEVLVVREPEFRKLLKTYKCYKDQVEKDSILLQLKYKMNSEDQLNASKVIRFREEDFSIIDESKNEQCRMPLIALVEIIKSKEEILMDLQTEDYFAENIYWSNDDFQIKTKHYKTFRILSFVTNNEDNPNISITAVTFKNLIRIVQDTDSDTDDEYMEVEESNCNSLRLTDSKRVEYSQDGRHFTLRDISKRKTVTLPISAHKAIQKYQMQILSDLEDDLFEPTYEKDFINEYWRGEGYAIRTRIYLRRDTKLHVVSFTRIKDNDFSFVIKKTTFLKLVENNKM